MTYLITNAIQQTSLVVMAVFIFIILSVRKQKDTAFFSLQTTAELKGLAILMVVLSHIGYFLVSDRRFLVPLSNYAGVGVDLFLILSGFGLAVSALKRPISIGKFYLKRIYRIYLPVVATVAFFLLLDYLVLHKIYPLKLSIENILGFFPQADLYNDVNSPLWYITLLLFYYLLFPLVFQRRFPVLSSLALAVIGWYAVKYVANTPHIFTEGVMKLYKLHFLGFPLGVAMGALLNEKNISIIKKFKWAYVLPWVLTALAITTVVHTYYFSHIGEGWKKEEMYSLITALAIITLFNIKKFDCRGLALFGLFSFEIYLFHWPLLYRYNFLYEKIPAGLATILYLALFLGIGYLYQLGMSKFSTIDKKVGS